MTDNTRLFEIENTEHLKVLFGKLDGHVDYIKQELGVSLYMRNNGLEIKGQEVLVEMTNTLLENLMGMIKRQKTLSQQEVEYAVTLVKHDRADAIRDILDEVICTTSYGKVLRPKTLGQKRYIDAIRKNDVVFGIGPAGTGKTYLAMAMAVTAFKNKEVNRIILTRPAVEAGESLGFLPGDLQEKIDPYLRPLYDALFEILGYDTYLKLLEKGLIEVAPLAYMRGRTLDSAYVVLDEAQNTTNEQMKMFLTRLGYGSKAIITGDVTQVDLPKGKSSGLVTVRSILKGVKGLSFVDFNRNDVVRHPLVQRIIDAYDRFEERG